VPERAEFLGVHVERRGTPLRGRWEERCRHQIAPGRSGHDRFDVSKGTKIAGGLHR
jgi:hypothetical protein